MKESSPRVGYKIRKGAREGGYEIKMSDNMTQKIINSTSNTAIRCPTRDAIYSCDFI